MGNRCFYPSTSRWTFRFRRRNPNSTSTCNYPPESILCPFLRRSQSGSYCWRSKMQTRAFLLHPIQLVIYILRSPLPLGEGSGVRGSRRHQYERKVLRAFVEKCGAKNFRTLLSLTIFRPTFFDRKHCSFLQTSLLRSLKSFGRWHPLVTPTSWEFLGNSAPRGSRRSRSESLVGNEKPGLLTFLTLWASTKRRHGSFGYSLPSGQWDR